MVAGRCICLSSRLGATYGFISASSPEEKIDKTYASVREV